VSPEDLLKSAKLELEAFVQHTVRTHGPEHVRSVLLDAAVMQCEHVETLTPRRDPRRRHPPSHDLLLEALAHAWGRKRTCSLLRQLVRLLDAHVDALARRRPRGSPLPPRGSL